jgi:hypothetical protein
MKYFLDTEFIEGPQKEKFPISLFRKETPNTIDLISIGIVAEDGREYYAVSKDFNLKEAWNRFDLEIQSGDMRNVFPNGRKVYWLRENVLKPIFMEITTKYDLDGIDFTYKNLKGLISIKGKTNKEIAKEVISFTKKAVIQENENGKYNIGTDGSDKITKGDLVWDNPEFYAYYADYDWVVFCWLFGKMIDLPKGFPMYCKDLKQMLDEHFVIDGELINYCEAVNDCDKKYPNKKVLQAVFVNEDIKNHPNFPKQTNEHNALADARWNKQLYEFLNNL